MHDQGEKKTPLALAPHDHGEKNSPHAFRDRVKLLHSFKHGLEFYHSGPMLF